MAIPSKLTQHFDWNKVLTRGEEIKLDFGPGEKYLHRGFLIGMSLGILTAILIIGIFFLLYTLFYFKFYLSQAFRYAFTNKRVLIHQGWLSRNLTSVDFNKITDIQVRDNVIEKWLFNTGAIIINTAGTGQAEVLIDKVENPHAIKQRLENLRNEYKEKFGY